MRFFFFFFFSFFSVLNSLNLIDFADLSHEDIDLSAGQTTILGSEIGVIFPC